MPPKSGNITYKGLSIDKLPPFKTCALGLGYVPEDRRIFSGLTILENLEVGKQPARKGLEVWTPERLFELFPNLAERRYQAGGTLSGGEQQMLTIARTLMGNPEMIILDEPSEGLAPVIVDQLADTIQRFKNEGVSILLAEQNLNFARFICDRAYIIYQGSVCPFRVLILSRASCKLEISFSRSSSASFRLVISLAMPWVPRKAPRPDFAGEYRPSDEIMNTSKETGVWSLVNSLVSNDFVLLAPLRLFLIL